MGPVISAESKTRIEGLIGQGLSEGGRVLVDGRGARVESYEKGFFLGPTILEDVAPQGELARTEIFGPVFSLYHARDVDEAIRLVNRRAQGNMACLSPRAAPPPANPLRGPGRQHRHQRRRRGADGLLPFSGWKDSFFGDLHGQGRDAVSFYTDEKVVVERWG